jgi:phage tail sheath gpL-like
MPMSASSMAAGVGASARNVKFESNALNVPRKVLVIGTYLPAKTEVDDEVLRKCAGPGDAADQYGFGSMLHHLIAGLWEGSGGVETWVIPQAEADGAAASAGEIDWAGSDVTEAGTLHCYFGGMHVPVTVVVGDDEDTIPVKVTAAAALNADLPVAVTTSTTTNVITAKSKGPWGDGFGVTLNEGFQQSLPAGATAAITGMSSGAGVPEIADALAALGTGDDANEMGFTDGICGYGQDSDTLDAISTFNGVGNSAIGLYLPTVARPIRFLVGDTAAGADGLAALLILGAARKADRTNGCIPVPGSPNHPMQIAAKVVGIAARLNNNRAAESTLGQIIPNVFPGQLDDRWTTEYDDRDTAVKNGISTTTVSGSSVLIGNLLTFYHPDSITPDSNSYRSYRNIAVVQNILANIRANFLAEKWQGISIVADTAKVTNPTDRAKARDMDSVMDDLVTLAQSFESRAWIYSAAFTIAQLKAGGCVAIRPGGLGFDLSLPTLLSGEGGIFNTDVPFDANISIAF